MPKQVEVRMHESHLEPIEARPQSKCAKIWSKMFKNLLLTLTILGKSPSSPLHFFLFFSFLPKDLIKSRACLRWAPATTERSVLLTQSSIMQLAHNMRRRCHLCLLSVPDSKMSGCPDLPQLCATCWYQKLSAALDKQPLVVHEKYHIYSSGSWLHRGRLNEKTKRHESGDAILGY